MQYLEQNSAEARTGLDTPTVAATRFLLAFSALAIILIDPTEPNRLVPETYAAVVLYTLYSLYIFVAIQFEWDLPTVVVCHCWWLDTAFYLVLISLSSGTNSIFFFFFFFSVLTAAFARGFNTGIAVTIASAAGFWLVALLFTPTEVEADLGRYLLRPLSLLIIGYVMSIWGGSDKRSRQRLELLRNIGTLSNPRFGIDRTITINLDLIRTFYGADGCLLIERDNGTGQLEAHSSSKFPDGSSFRSLKPGSAVAAALLAPSSDLAAAFVRRPWPYAGRWRFDAFDRATRRFVPGDESPHRHIAEILDANSLISCPVVYRHDSVGQFFVHSSRPNCFNKNDLPFLIQAVDHFIPIVENVRLVDQMASDAADQERKKIARDIHDSIIQPYIGMRMGIESLAQFVDGKDDAALDTCQLGSRIERLKLIADQSIDGLRDYVNGLSGDGRRPDVLRESLHRFAEKYRAMSGITVAVEIESGLAVGDRLAAEIFQIVTEAVSNVRKHTSSEAAFVRISSEDDQLVVSIADNGGGGCSDFVPRSIAARSAALGGSMGVAFEDGLTVVRVSIPM